MDLKEFTEEYLPNRYRPYVVEYIIKQYSEPHRHYHTLDHVLTMINEMDNHFDDITVDLTNDELEGLIDAIIFHDICYNPKHHSNEFESGQTYKIYGHNDRYSDEIKMKVITAIESTIVHRDVNNISKYLNKLDLSILSKPLVKQLEFEDQIFKEYQWCDYDKYKSNRIEKLIKLGAQRELIDYIKNRKISVGIFPGSFNPLHVGHLDIIKRAEKIFDKVVIAVGNNPDKSVEKFKFPKSLEYHQVIKYANLTAEMFNEIGGDRKTLIRGLRNISDFEFEKLQFNYNSLMNSDLETIYFISKPEHEIISSTSVKKLGKGNPLIVK